MRSRESGRELGTGVRTDLPHNGNLRMSPRGHTYSFNLNWWNLDERVLTTMINPHYVSTITDEKLEERLFQKENIVALEELLVVARGEYRTVQHLQSRKRPASRNIRSQAELEEVFDEVRGFVDHFLGFHFKEKPNCSFSRLRDFPGISLRRTTKLFYALGIEGVLIDNASLAIDKPMPFLSIATAVVLALAINNHYAIRNTNAYHFTSDRILLQREKYETLIPTLAHEYAHALQGRFPALSSRWEECEYFIEGHARGVQRYAARSYWERDENPAFMDFTVREDARELHVAYRLLCERFSQQPREVLVKGLPKETLGQRLHRRAKEKVDPHIIGNAVMLLEEARHGSGIYRDMLHGHYTF